MNQKPALSDCVSRVGSSVFADLQLRIDEFTRTGGDLIALQIGDTHLDPPRAVDYGRIARCAKEQGAAASFHRYGSTSGLASLRGLIAQRLRIQRGIEADPDDNILIGSGATHAIACAARAILNPGDDVLLAAPYWPLAPGIFKLCGARTIDVPFTTELYANPSADAGSLLDKARTDRTRAIYLITPNNPDGKVLSRPQLESIASFASTHNLWVIADEVYADTTYGVEHTSLVRVPGMEARTVTAFSFSKSHALAGARVGYVVGPAEVVRAARRVSTHTVYNVPVIAQEAALAALTDGDGWPASAREEYRRARELTHQVLAELGVEYFVPEGGTYYFVNFARRLRGHTMQTLLEGAIQEGVLLAPGEAFGAAYSTWARVCFSGEPLARLEEGLRRLGRALSRLEV